MATQSYFLPFILKYFFIFSIQSFFVYLPGENDNKAASFFLHIHVLLILLFSGLFSLQTFSQCPDNIDFEQGNFNNWTCYTGSVSGGGGQNTISLTNSGPVINRHTMYSAPTTETDYFGGFPVLCPNGSGHSVKLGNNTGGGQAEGISYEFTIPAGRDVYSLIYHYAVVFQDPHHEIFQQPRLEIEVTNVTDNQVLYCSSFTFIPYGETLLPGFFLAATQQDTTNIWCKDWSAVSINLDNNAGKTIRLFFKTADCTFTRHFGYAYLDVNTECSSEFVGATYCPNDAFVNVTAPYGYQDYTWFNNNFSQVLGNAQSITFTPPPPVGTTIAVQVTPYSGYGCLDTLYAQLIDTLTVRSIAGKDGLSCNQDPVQIGSNSIPGLAYSWSPPAGLSNPNIANPRAGPSVTTQYILTTSSAGGGCRSTDTVLVKASIIDTSIRVVGNLAYCTTSGDSAVLYVQPTDSIQWLKDGLPIPGQNRFRFHPTQSGTYSAIMSNRDGCVATTSSKTLSIETPQPGIRYPIAYAISGYPQQLKSRTFGLNVEWSPPSFLNSSSTTIPKFTGTADQLYTIAIVTAAGCLTVDTQQVKVFREAKFYVPTGFTPNNDGLNDYLRPIPVGIKEIKYFRIYNRWGQLVFDLKENELGWDGKIGGKLQGSQVLVWMAEGIGINDQVYKQKGTCVLIR